MAVAAGLSCGTVQAQAPATEQSDQLQEVVVTATKRAENLKDVPISISVLSGDQLQQQQIASLDDLTRTVPDLANTGGASGPGQGNYEIRGVSGDGSITSLGQPTIGTYLDDISMTVPTGAGVGATQLKFFDIDHVEVLRGPQGTLYGASSMGGTIRFISNQPDLSKFGGSALTELSNTEHGSLNYVEQGVLNLPLVSGVLAARVGVQYTQDSGYINVQNPDSGKVAYKGVNDDRATVVRASIKYQSPDSDLTIVPALLLQRETYGGQPSYDLDSPFNTPQYITPRSYDNSLIPSLTITKDVLGATLTSATSYFQRESRLASDSTLSLEGPITGGTLFWPTVFYLPNDVHQYSEELRVASKSMQESGLPFSWVGGVFLSEQVDDTYADLHTVGSTADYYAALNASGNGTLAQQLSTYTPGNNLFSQFTHYELQQTSVFGEFSYSPIKPLTLTAGLREVLAHEGATEYVGGYYQWFDVNGGTVTDPGATKSHTLTPKFAVRYDLSESASIYANAVEGFRLGGVNGPIPLSSGCLYSLNQIGLSSAPLQYGPDKLWSYELGSKSTFFDNRLSVDASAFYIVWNKVQQGINLPGTPTDPCAQQFTTNAGQARSDGFDLDVKAKLTSFLTLSATGNVTHAVITDPAPDTGTVDGSHLEGVPMWTATLGASWSQPVTNQLSDFASFDMDFIGRSYGVFDATSPAYDYPEYQVLNASAGIALGDVQLSLFAKNLLNESKDIAPGSSANPTPSGSTYYTGTLLRPRTIGVSASIKF